MYTLQLSKLRKLLQISFRTLMYAGFQKLFLVHVSRHLQQMHQRTVIRFHITLMQIQIKHLRVSTSAYEPDCIQVEIKPTSYICLLTAPWTDVYGRYFNRAPGKPRFVSCLIYLNYEWSEKWGAPTQFFDPPTGETHQVFPSPGRCVMMDQDVTHTVVAPNESAGLRPRYSLVWKLILHPKKSAQNMALASGSKPLLIGSANGKVQ